MNRTLVLSMVCATALLGSLLARVEAASLIQNKARLAGANKAEALAAIRELAVLQSAEAVDVLAAQLNRETDNYFKIQIIEALAVQNSTAAVAAIDAMMAAPDPYVRRSAIKNRAYMPETDSSIQKMKAVVLNDTDEVVRKNAINTLGLYKSTAAADAIETVLKNSRAPRDVRRAAVKSLMKMDTDDAKDRLRAYTGDADPEISKGIAAMNLGKKKKVKK